MKLPEEQVEGSEVEEMAEGAGLGDSVAEMVEMVVGKEDVAVSGSATACTQTPLRCCFRLRHSIARYTMIDISSSHGPHPMKSRLVPQTTS